MSSIALRRWLLGHKWTSLVCTLFLLLLCVAGLPLVLREELGGLLDSDPPYADLPATTPMGNLDRMV
ncbi:MAG: PepSY domain-containing protein [Proteobacteria bacterium]|nr:PepSY domain-containing protein [Pseudomonadota bacterium]